jgi:hypothetical protein
LTAVTLTYSRQANDAKRENPDHWNSFGHPAKEAFAKEWVNIKALMFFAFSELRAAVVRVMPEARGTLENTGGGPSLIASFGTVLKRVVRRVHHDVSHMAQSAAKTGHRDEPRLFWGACCVFDELKMTVLKQIATSLKLLVTLGPYMRAVKRQRIINATTSSPQIRHFGLKSR